MKSSPSITKIAAALARAQLELKALPKTATNPTFRSHYTPFEDIVAHARAVLAKVEISPLQGCISETTAEGLLVALTVETTLLHSSGEWISESVPIPVLGRMFKDDGGVLRRAPVDAWSAGSAIAYGRRYGLSTTLSLATEEEDDGNLASQAPTSAPRSSRRAVPYAGKAAYAIGVSPDTVGASLTGASPTGGREPMPALICAKCGATEFWDNRGDASPNFKCKKCGQKKQIGEPPSLRKTALPVPDRDGHTQDDWEPDESQSEMFK
jgi:hypothetical protein